ncbi:type II methionyl aminopeptidase [Sulfolobus sp. S-194]|uniref:type II methionyl aminopeptidase n=1 Tax=Sulfolobus sp. S-194 TaxID=2512240 RepID=UPI0014371CDC|nr:type II methionyl aminopeptidase [Sulfolobus sp. S-194]QIW24297.1 type II methionyl aminopeptidase [Sulfolobus sp. S-194]
MEESSLELLRKAGKIAAKARDYGAKLIKPGAKVYDICETVEKIIIEEGAKPAFPCNLSINSEAAHYSPLINDEKTIPEGAVVKLDIGAHIDGYITDTAVTVVLDEKFQKLAEAARDALNAAISNFKPGTDLGEIGKNIEKIIKIHGFKPIRNLGGHLIRRYELHAGVFVPNIYERGLGRIIEGNTYAIEPFATNGEGEVIEGKDITIYSIKTLNTKGLTDEEKRFLAEIYKRANMLPFNERWLRDLGEPDYIRQMLKTLVRRGALRAYPILIEVRKGLVSQFEHTVLVTRDGAEIIT